MLVFFILFLRSRHIKLLVLYKSMWVNLRKNLKVKIKNKNMLTQEVLFAKALMVDKQWLVVKVQFNQ